MKTFSYYLKQIEEIGFVEECNYSIIYASGLPNATVHELVIFETGEAGMILSLGREHAEILMFSKYSVKVGTKVTRTGTKQQMPVGFELLGQTVDSFGQPLEPNKNFTKPQLSRPIDSAPGGISTRKRITQPLETGISMVDFLVPLGRGQRELIIGDRKTGKTSFLHQAILKQAKLGTICIYGAIGKKQTDIKKTQDFFKQSGIEKNTVIIASGSEDPSGIIYLTPYAAMTLAEYFRDEGHDVLVVLDDLLTHAKFYREIMLIGRRFPGRNAYPADIFYTHAKLLERAGNFTLEGGSEHSITCLPIVESVEGDIAGFIQSNLMSMTDGHIYFDVDLFTKGHRPSVNPFLSVSRVGRQTQSSLRLSLHRELISFMTIHQRLENFSHFGSETGANVKRTLLVGQRIFSYFTQGATEVRSLDFELILFAMLWQDIWQNIDTMEDDMKKMRKKYEEDLETQTVVKDIIESSSSLNDLLGKAKEKKESLFTMLGVTTVQIAATPPPAQQTEQAPKPEVNGEI
jgi:F-type H+-transporting ATPase subunit alpha